MKVDWKKLREKIAIAHWQLQRFISVGLAIFAGAMSVFMLIPLGGDYEYDSPEPAKWLWKAAGCIAVGFVAALMHWKTMKRRYPEYPHHKDKDLYPPW